ncbi:PqqD family peptide modification chaperone [Aminipila terrae]|uniref:PqqD family peptide modification chaperone n=1 Tax=Aminipila terrae TaxID=2697030 RepID=A0A6P1MKC0_9FIRM|nr:PqqD family peptide modification chaperone [Aminipila terrae]QHI72488.1 PqqD family peptide modification chaperone [Aminipila terrae]
MSAKQPNLLDIIFQVSSKLLYEVSDEGIVTILIKQDHMIQRFFRKLRVKIPEYRQIAMDDFGSYAFLQIDGHKTVREIGEALEAKFGDKVHPLYERLSLFLTYIQHRCHYIEKVQP